MEAREDSLVEVVLTLAASVGSTRGITLHQCLIRSKINFRQCLATHVSHARSPAIIFPDGREYTAAIGSEGRGKKFSSGLDVEVLIATNSVCKLWNHV